MNRQEVVITSESDGINIEKNLFYSDIIFNGGFRYVFKTGNLKWIAGELASPENMSEQE